ncbi:MAG TPA: hypothetical protein VF503_05410 [Sphingobium sp.]
MNHDNPCADFLVAHDIADPHFDQIAAAQPAINGKIEERSITNPAALTEKKRIAPIWRGLKAHKW